MDYQGLYSLQDEVLREVASCGTSFYLGGGTALSRYYLDHRFSDDLDFFLHDKLIFSEESRLVRAKLGEHFSEVLSITDSRGFKRLVIKKGNHELKIDLVLDIPVRFGRLQVFDGVLVDCPRNILSNKLGAFCGRDEPRDVTDLLALARMYRFSWDQILEEFRAKESFNQEELLLRMASFPLRELDRVPSKKPRDESLDQSDWTIVGAEVAEGKRNSLAPPSAPELF
jgi:predicted nucleotidyltransferase component of viral defense system